MKNDNVNPVFLPVLNAIFPPSKVAAELRERERLVELAEAQRAVFDEWDDAIMNDVVGCKRLQGPIQDLLILGAQVKDTQDSFGVNAERLAQMVIPMLKALREACIAELNDQ